MSKNSAVPTEHTGILDLQDTETMTRYFAQKTWRAMHDKYIARFRSIGASDFEACVNAMLARQAEGIRDAEEIERIVTRSMEARYNLVATAEEQETAYNKIDSLFAELPEHLRQQAGKSLRRKLYGAKLGDSRVTPAIAGLLSYMNLPENYWE